jgi:hypothetical protein
VTNLNLATDPGEVKRLRKALEFIAKVECSPKYWAECGPGLQRVARAALRPRTEEGVTE